jgi:hypothetical protein
MARGVQGRETAMQLAKAQRAQLCVGCHVLRHQLRCGNQICKKIWQAIDFIGRRGGTRTPNPRFWRPVASLF